jgi:ribonuclease Z
MSFEAYVLGTGGTMPLPGRFLTSVLLRREGELILFDCGEGTQVALRRLGLRWKNISTIFISHTHADHVTGLPGILMLSSQVERDQPLHIYGPPRIREYIESSRRTLEMYINYEIVIHEILKPDVPADVHFGDGYRVQSFPLSHSRVCLGYTLIEDPRPGLFFPEKARECGVPMGPFWGKLQSGESVELSDGQIIHSTDVLGPARSGRKFTYVTDSLPISSISTFMENADLVMCEGMYLDAEKDTAEEKRHMTGVQAAKLAVDAGGVKKLGLFHFSPRYTKREIFAIEQEAQAIFSPAFAARDGMHIDIPFED